MAGRGIVTLGRSSRFRFTRVISETGGEISQSSTSRADSGNTDPDPNAGIRLSALGQTRDVGSSFGE